jgi:hypothetical protein
MGTDGWNLTDANLLGNASDLAVLRDLARAWPALSPDERAQRMAAVQAKFPDLELTPEDVGMMVAKFNEMGDVP